MLVDIVVSRSATRAAPLAATAVICALSMAAQPASAGELSDTATGNPALAAFNGALYIAWTGTDASHGAHTLNVGRLGQDGVTIVARSSAAGNRSNTGPALAAFNGKLYLAWSSTDDSSNHVNVAASSDGLTFSAQKLVGDNTTFAAPALAASANALYIVWSGKDPNHTLNAAFSNDGLDFTGQVLLSGTTSIAAPALAVLNDSLYLGYRSGVNLVSLLKASINPPLSFTNTGVPLINGTTGGGPALATANNQLFLSWPGFPNGSNGVNVDTFQQDSTGALNLLSQLPIAPQTGTNPAIAGLNGHVYIAWTGVNAAHNLNIEQVF